MMNLMTRGLEGQEITENRGPEMQVVILVFYALSVVFCIARFLTRGILLRAFGADDYMMLVTLVFSTCVTLTCPILVNSGAGVHQWELRKDQISYIHKMAWLSQVFYLPTLWALKLSILGLYSRLTTEPLHRKILIGFASVITAHAFAATIVNINICKPQRIIWDVDLFPKGCINLLDFNYFNAAFHIATDVALVILPIPILSGLQVSTRKKIGLICVFSLGLSAVALTIARVALVLVWANSPLDFSWTWMPVALTSGLEIDVAMIMACLPALNILIKRVFKLSSTVGDSKGYELERPSNGPSGGSGKGRQRASLGYNTTIFAKTVTGNESEENIMHKVSLERRERENESVTQFEDGNRVIKTIDFTVERSEV